MARRSIVPGPAEPVREERDAAELGEEIAHLRDLDLETLKLRWRNRFGRNAPANLPRYLLVRLFAYRLQAEASGDLDASIVEALDRIARGNRFEPSGGSIPLAEPRTLRPGTLITRECNGVLQRVMVLQDGFAWNGVTYQSLSQVARAITGTRWSGPAFFGLGRDKPRTDGLGPHDHRHDASPKTLPEAPAAVRPGRSSPFFQGAAPSANRIAVCLPGPAS